MTEPLLSVEALQIGFQTADGARLAVRGVSFSIQPGEVLGLVGESGSGKTTIALAILSYLPRGASVSGGRIVFKGTDLATLTPGRRRALNGSRIAHVSQDPSGALNPVLTVERQLTEGLQHHKGLSAAQARARALDLMREVHLNNGEALLRQYPHQLSGGMQQRLCIAMALAADPDLIVMDEPTTGLDATTEVAIFELLRELRSRRKLSVVFISHNLAAVRGLADRVVILYAGRLVESGPTPTVFGAPRHRYTELMLRAVPVLSGPVQRTELPWQSTSPPADGCSFRDRCDLRVDACSDALREHDVSDVHRSACVRWQELPWPDAGGAAPSEGDLASKTVVQRRVLQVRGLSHTYKRSPTPAIESLDLDLYASEVLAVIGESGSGKTTLARCLVALETPTNGEMQVDDVSIRSSGTFKAAARHIQIVFQNIAASLHPRKRISTILERPYLLYEGRRPSESELERVANAFGLRADLLQRRTSRISGGERQRVALARAIAPKPSVVVLDEAFSALDVSMKNKVLNLLLRARGDTEASYLLISHDLPLVRSMADRILVLYRGWVCETGSRSLLETPPHHPYTEALIWSALELEGRRPVGLDLARTWAPSTARPRSGCPFHPRCPRKIGSICEQERPPMQVPEGGEHQIACHIPLKELARLQQAERMEPEAAGTA